jgi:hypothetical protein
MWKLRATTLEEIHDAIATSTFQEAMRVWATNIMGHTDIS